MVVFRLSSSPFSVIFFIAFFIFVIASFFFQSVLSESDSSSVIQLPTDINDDDGGGGDITIIPCARSNSSIACPVKCFRTNPVCGIDDVTYWCGCAEAFCAGIKVAKLGFCEVRNGGSSGQALLLVHIVWLILLGVFVLFGLL